MTEKPINKADERTKRIKRGVELNKQLVAKFGKGAFDGSDVLDHKVDSKYTQAVLDGMPDEVKKALKKANAG